MNTGTPHLPLRDIHLPPPVSWWPPAIGWWIVFFIVLLLCLGLWLFFKHRQSRKHQRASIQSLTSIRNRYNEEQNNTQLLRDLSVLMRRSCITFYPRHLSAGLTGNQWLKFLDETSSKTEFSNGIGKVLASAPYLPDNARISIDASALLNLCEQWLHVQPSKKFLANPHKNRTSNGAQL